MWPQLRAGLIAGAIFFGLVDGCPIPPPADTPPWERGLVAPIRSVKDAVETPVAWIVPAMQVSQRWALYQSPGGQRYRMSIEGRRSDGTWTILYRAADPDHDEDSDVLEAGRVWGSFDPTDRPPPQYRAFCVWITGRFMARHPELDAVRVRQEMIAFLPGAIESTGRYEFECVRAKRAP